MLLYHDSLQDLSLCMDVYPASSRLRHLVPLTPPTLLTPLQPTPPILTHVLIANLPCQLSRRTTPNTSFTIKHKLLICGGLFETKFIFKFVGGHEKGVWSGTDGDVDGGGDVAGFEFGGFAYVCGRELGLS